MRIGYLLVFIVLSLSFTTRGQDLYVVSKGNIRFNSRAPKELIHATSDNMKGVFDADKKTFAFKIDIGSFTGFNTSLQKEHFNESYMESGRYPLATYTGKVIEDVDLRYDGEYNVRAKGKLVIHGMEQERIINSKIIVDGEKITIRSTFPVALADHNIKIPRVVYDKLAPDINVDVNAVLVPKPR
jgi:hypothetical protein